MKIVTVGSRVFLTSFQLDGVQRPIIESSEKALEEITKLMNDSSVELVLVSDDISKTIGNKLTELRSKKSIPPVFELPAPGCKKGEVTIEAAKANPWSLIHIYYALMEV